MKTSRAIPIFVSSPLSAFTAERDLQRYGVFPMLRQL